MTEPIEPREPAPRIIREGGKGRQMGKGSFPGAAHKAPGDILTPAQRRFVNAYLTNDGDVYGALLEAGYSDHKEGRDKYKAGNNLLRNPNVARAIALGRAEIQRRIDFERMAVLKEVAGVAFADARELIGYHRLCCRYCWGEGGQYLYTPAEWNAIWADYQRKSRKLKDGETLEPPDPKGGIGFDSGMDPNPECRECNGQGVGKVVIADTRKLSPHAAALFAGIKVTDKSVEIKTHPKFAALELLSRITGLLKPEDAPPQGSENFWARVRAAQKAEEARTINAPEGGATGE